MVKRRREETDSGGVIYDMTSYKTVFIDTNLDTHLAVIVSDSDTVSDLKRKIMFEHLRCFPEMGELKISSVKVKRKGHYYHLPDTMLVRCVFEGIKKGWFLSADASRIQCLGNDQGLLCITYPRTEAENLLPSDSFRAMDKQMVFYTTKSYPDHGNLASSSIMKQKFKNVKPMDNSQELSPRSGPMAKKRKTKHKEDALDLPVTDTHTSKHGIDSESEVKVVESDTTSTHFNEGERENINMKLEDVSAEPLRNQPSDPSKVSKLGMKKRRIGGASVEISGVLDELRGNRNNDTLDETSQSGAVANKVKILGSKESSRGSTFNHRDILKITIPENSTAGKSIKAAAAEMLGDQSVRTDTAHKNRKKKGKDSSTCHDEVSGMVLGSTDKFEGARGLEKKEGVEMKIFDKLTDVDSTIHVTQSRLKETSPVKDHGSSKECPAPVSTEFYEMNLVGRPIFESIVSGNNKLVIDVAYTTVEQEELIPNCDCEMPVSEKLDEASTRDPVPSYQLGDSQGAAENSFGRKRSKAKKSTPHQELDMKNIVEASQNAYASDQDIVRHDDSSDATTKVGSIMPKTDVDHINVGKEGKSLVTQGAETSFTSDNNEATRTTKEQILSDKTAFDDKGNIESGNASSTKQKKKSRRKSAEKIPDKLDGEDDSSMNCPSLAAGIGPITDPVTEQSKKGEVLFDAGKLQIGLNTVTQGAETSFPSYNNEATGTTKEQILSAKTALDDKRNIESGNASSTKQKKKSRRKSAEKIPDKLDGEDDSRVNCPSFAAGIGPITDPVTEQSKKGEISLDAGKLQIGPSTEVKGAETSFPSENNEATGSTKEQILSAKTALDDKQNIESGNASSTKQKKKSRRKSAEKIPDKLDGEDDSRVNCPSFAAGIGPITDLVTEQSKKGEILLDAGKLQIGLSTEVKGAETSFPSENNEATGSTKEQILSAKTALDDKRNIESGNASSTKQKKKSRRKSAEKIPDKLDGEDDSRVNCPSFAAGIGPITDPVTEQSKKGEISLDAGKLQIGLSTEVKGAETSFPSENNEATGSTKEQILSAKTALDDKQNIESGNASSTKQRKKSCRKSAEKIPDKLDGEDDSTVNWPSLAAGIGPITDPVTEKSKKGEISLDAGKLQIGLSTEAKGSSHNKDLVQVHFATCRSSDDAKAEMTIKEVETISTAPSNVKVAEGHGNSGRIKKKKSKKEVSTYINDVSCAPSAMHDPPANHFVKGSTQDKNALPASKKKGASEQVSKSAYAAGSHQQVEKATCIEAELLPTEEKGNEAEQLLLNQTDKNQKTVSIVEKKLKTKTKKSQSSKKGKSILSVQDQEVSHKELAASTDNLGDVNSLPEPMEMNKSGKSSHVDQLAVTKLDNQRNCGINSNFESSRKDVRNADSFRVPSYTLAKGALEEMHEPDVNTDKSDGINFKQYFVLGQHGEVASKKPTKSNRDTKAGSKSKDTMTSRGTSEDIMNSRIEVALPSRSSAQGDKTLEETGKLATFDAPAYKKKSEESMDESMSSSSSKGSDRVPEDNRWQTGSETQSLATRKTKMRTGNIEDFTQPKKGLPPTPGPKFWGSRSRRSDSKGGGNSDSTTETPSDYSSSSGSVEGSEISQASTPNGANVAKCNDDGAKHKLKSNLLGQDITMDMILRSSIRFKKAKVTAAKCQDEDSQPVDIVPDSLADTPNQ